MTTMASQIISLMVVYSTVYSDADQRKHQSSASLAFVWGIHRDRWIPRTKGQLRGKCFHLMTSSWITIVKMVSWMSNLYNWKRFIDKVMFCIISATSFVSGHELYYFPTITALCCCGLVVVNGTYTLQGYFTYIRNCPNPNEPTGYESKCKYECKHTKQNCMHILWICLGPHYLRDIT